MIGTHNSLSYLPVYQWWLKTFFLIAKCQKKNIYTQFHDGVRYFDIRCKWNGKKYISGHGLITYQVDIESVLSILNSRVRNCNDSTAHLTTIRLMLEDHSEEDFFKQKAQEWRERFTYLKWADARIKSGFKLVLEGNSTVEENHEYQLFQDYSATTFWEKVKGFKFPCPWYWARKKQVTEEMKKDNIFHILDFV